MELRRFEVGPQIRIENPNAGDRDLPSVCPDLVSLLDVVYCIYLQLPLVLHESLIRTPSSFLRTAPAGTGWVSGRRISKPGSRLLGTADLPG